jgi:hypothetical protein
MILFFLCGCCSHVLRVDLFFLDFTKFLGCEQAYISFKTLHRDLFDHHAYLHGKKQNSRLILSLDATCFLTTKVNGVMSWLS